MFMGKLIDTLNHIINENAKLEIKKNICEITEDDKGTKLKKVTIELPSDNIIVFSPDQGLKKQKDNSISPLLSKNKGCIHHKVCDAVILDEYQENRLSIIYVELKSRDTRTAKAQFKSTKCFILYIKEILKILYKIEEHQKIEVKHKFIVFVGKAKNSIRKKTTFGKSNRKPASTDIENPTLYEIGSTNTIKYKNFV
jgi:hypothetical protein